MDSSNKEENFDPFNPKPDKKSEENKSDDNINILYITIGIIMLLIFVWVIVVIMNRDDDIKILNEMSKNTNHTKLALDK